MTKTEEVGIFKFADSDFKVMRTSDSEGIFEYCAYGDGADFEGFYTLGELLDTLKREYL